MSYPSKGASARRATKNHKVTPLGVEQLEARLLNSINSIQDSLNQLIAPSSVVGATFHTSLNTAPTFTTGLSSGNGQTVQAKTVNVNVSGSDDGGERNLRYSWNVTEAPSDGTVRFKANNNNASKSNTLTFSRAGSYTVQVSVIDREGLSTSTSLQFNVTQVLTTIQIKNGDLALKSGATIANRATGQTLQALAFDQFGQAMTVSPTFTWSCTSAPDNAAPTLTTNGSSATFRFAKSGAHAIQLSTGGLSTTVNVNVAQTLTQIQLFSSNQSSIASGQTLTTSSTSVLVSAKGYDQFGLLMAAQPKFTWNLVDGPSQGTVRATLGNTGTSFAFNKVGTYTIRTTSGTATAHFLVSVAPTLTSLNVVNGEGRAIATSGATSMTAQQVSLTLSGADQFGNNLQTALTYDWSNVSAPSGGTATITATGSTASIAFSKAGTYYVRVTSGAFSRTLSFTILQVATSVTVTSTSTSFSVGSTQQFRATAYDQFNQAMSTSSFSWTASGGTITSSGLLTSGTTAGTYSVTARTGSVTGALSFSLTSLAPNSAIKSSSLSSLVTTLYVDGSISRSDMIQILRAAGSDGRVDATEFSDLQLMVSSISPFSMSDYVRVLASDVVVGNTANRTYKGVAAGNLASGSSSTLLNNLVDKWFLGTDDPTVSSSSYSYQVVSGSLFASTPSRNDAHQGMLGDCYFISSLVSLADENPNAVRNMFIDNGDGTFTVRFYGGRLGSFVQNGLVTSGFASGSGVAEYVTVSRKLPTYSNGMLVYSNYGSMASSQSNTLWIALAEKAYAQWNESGNEGRNGTNTYSGIEGGWMSNVYAQVLGYNGTNYSFSNTPKQTLINALNSGKAVTLGTLSGASAGGLVGGHAYTVVSYNANTDTFTLHNPWGMSHPGQLTYSQLQSNCSLFTVADPTGTTAFAQARVQSGVAPVVVGTWAPSAATVVNTVSARDQSVEVLSAQNQGETLVQASSDDREDSFYLEPVSSISASDILVESADEIAERILIDLAMAAQHLDSILGV